MRIVSPGEVTRELVEGLGVDEILAVRTDLNRADRRTLGRALGKHWGMRFRRTDEGDLIWMRSCTSALGVKIHRRSLSWYVDRIKSRTPFTLLRWGDYLATETVYPGFGFQAFTPELRADMRRILAESVRDDPHYVMALAPIYHFVRMGLWGHTAHLFAEFDLLDAHWVSTEIFNRHMFKGELWPFIRALRSVRVLVVGPHFIRPVMVDTLPGAAFLEIPEKHAHSATEETIEAISTHPEVDVITISAGPAAQVWAHRLWPTVGQTTTVINFGSTWMPFAGLPGHVSHHGLTEKTMRRNRGEPT